MPDIPDLTEDEINALLKEAMAERVFCSATVDLGDAPDTFKVRVVPMDLSRYMPTTYVINAPDEDVAARMGIDRYVRDQQGLDRVARESLPGLPGDR